MPAKHHSAKTKYFSSYPERPEYIIYKDSTKPELLTMLGQDGLTKIAFQKGGKRYLFSNDDGHVVISNSGHSIVPMERKEFEEVRDLMIDSTNNCNSEKKATYLKEIGKLDYHIGHANSTFEVITKIGEPTTIQSLIINLGNLRYVYSQDKKTVLKVNVLDRCMHSIYLEGEEKERIIGKITNSKTMTKKIAKTTGTK